MENQGTCGAIYILQPLCNHTQHGRRHTWDLKDRPVLVVNIHGLSDTGADVSVKQYISVVRSVQLLFIQVAISCNGHVTHAIQVLKIQQYLI